MVPSFEQFKSAVYESYIGSMKMHNQDEVEDYFKSDEAENEMKNQYRSLVKKYEAGIINESVILGSGAGGTAQCLILMF